MRTVLVFLAMTAPPYVAYADTLSQPKLADVYTNATLLLKSEALISKDDLSDEAHVDVMLNDSGLAWRRDQGAFQQQLYTILDHYRDLSPNEKDELNLLVKFNNLAVNSMTAMTFCNKLEADWELSIEATLLDHVKADIESISFPNWNISLRGDPKLTGGCK